MDELTVLLTGDYWHSDFKDLIAKANFAVTLRSIESILADAEFDKDYRLIVVACSRRGKVKAAKLERLLVRYPNVPVVTLLGSWCEGEERSGTPTPGLIRVYWHQWQGRIERFIDCVHQDRISSWQLPKIASAVDRVIHDCETVVTMPEVGKCAAIGISSQNEESYWMLNEALGSVVQDTFWIEGKDQNVIDGVDLSVICVEANSLNDHSQQRLLWLQRRFPTVPVVLVINFPRREEYEMAARFGVSEIVSKPFQLTDLHSAVARTQVNRAA